MHTLIAVLLVVAVAVTFFFWQPAFGRVTHGGERLERIRQSKNFSKEKFRNYEPTTLMTGDKSLLDTMVEFIFGSKPEELRPAEGQLPVVRSDLKNLPADGDLYVWFGHSSFLLRLGGVTILADPVFYKAAPVSFVNKPFLGTDIYHPEDMPDVIDYLVISHDHWDHLDYQTVRELRGRVRHVVCPLGVGEDFERWGYSQAQIIEKDWWEEELRPDIAIHCLPTRHFTGRGIWNPKTMPAAWLFEVQGHKVFFSGDGGYSGRFVKIGEKFRNIDLAIMENGQYDRCWSMIHTMPQYLGREVKELGAKRFVTIHHSKFCLANHPWDEPRANEKIAAQESGVELITCKIGEVVKLW